MLHTHIEGRLKGSPVKVGATPSSMAKDLIGDMAQQNGLQKMSSSSWGLYDEDGEVDVFSNYISLERCNNKACVDELAELIERRAIKNSFRLWGDTAEVKAWSQD
jgi:hypothetical protein